MSLLQPQASRPRPTLQQRCPHHLSYIDLLGVEQGITFSFGSLKEPHPRCILSMETSVLASHEMRSILESFPSEGGA